MNRRSILLGAAALAACARGESQARGAAPFPIQRGVNLGNALEAPREGDWGYRIEADHLSAIADAGFDGVRLPVRWDAHAANAAPYTISPALLERVRELIDAATTRGLKLQLDLHHFDAFIQAGPRSPQRAHFLAIWRQIAEAFRDAPDGVLFEPLNEPNGATWSGRALAAVQAEVIDVIRASNSERLIVLGPGNWQNIDALNQWAPPARENIAVSVHYYEPHAFTHQDAEWLGDDAPRFDRAWGDPDDVRAVQEHIARAASWGERYGFALQLGEFGVNRAVSPAQRAAWTRAVREACEAGGIGWCVWDFAGAFPIWDRDRRDWLPGMREALLG
ncbi:MAG: glycoside hydrolase family 5 protein [Hyphomonadaceae bacterium]